MALFVSGEDVIMNISRFEVEGPPAPASGAKPQRAEVPVRAESRGAPTDKDKKEDQGNEEPIEEPGYGHGV